MSKITREEFAAYCRSELKNPNNKPGDCYHIGIIELRALADMVFGGTPINEEQTIYNPLFKKDATPKRTPRQRG